jgi:outer membrane protein W
MKNYKNLFFAALLVGAASFTVNAQIRLGAGVMTGLPMGDFADVFGFGIGGGVSGEYMLTDNIGAGLSVGFLSFAPQSEFEDIASNLTMIPIHLQGNYHFMPGEDFNFYAGLGLGINMITSTVPEISVPFFGVIQEEAKETESEFAIIPRIGVNYMFTDVLGLDFNLGYALVGDFSYVPINIGVVYNLD